MQKKNLRKTEGLPFTLGIISGVVLLLEAIISFNLSSIIMNVTWSTVGLESTASGTSVWSVVGSVVGFLIVPGIFLLLLILGKNKEKRGSAFAVVWLVIAILNVLTTVVFLVQGGDLQQSIVSAVDAVMPQGYWIMNGLSILGSALMGASCIVFLKRLHEPPVFDEEEVQPWENPTQSGNPQA